jgi:CRISPR/Cas system-associated protein Cas7 (RAMP superfamily)
MPKFTVRITHWIDNDSGDYDEYIEEEVEALDEAAAVASVREEYPEHSWDAYVTESLA